MLNGRRCCRQPAHRLVAQIDLAAVEVLEARNRLEKSGLAAAGRSEQRQELVAADLEVDAVERRDEAAFGRLEVLVALATRTRGPVPESPVPVCVADIRAFIFVLAGG